MALDACMLIKMNGKEFEGTSKKTGHLKSSTIVHAVSHDIITPVDIAQGSVTHRRQHGLMTVSHNIDAAVYQIYNAVIDKDRDGSKKLEVTLQFYRPNQDNVGIWGAGENAPFYKIVMTDAFVTSVGFRMEDVRATGALAGSAAAGRGEYLITAFAYRQIEWTYMNGNKATQDSWDAK